MSAHVWELLDRKGKAIISVQESTTAHKAVELMTENNIGCVLVVTQDGTLAGICSERDIFRKVVLGGKTAEETKVREIMTPRQRLLTVTRDTTLTECMDLISENRVRHLPVLDENGGLTGIISIGDVVKTLSSEKDLMIRQLEHYISGSL